MALPPEHPFWAAWALILPLSAASGLLVYFRAHRLATPALVAARSLQWVRRTGAIGCTLSAMALGMIIAVIYGWLGSVAPDSAHWILGVAGTTAAVALSAVAAILRRHEGLTGTGELIVLNLLWGCGYGWLLPVVAGPIGRHLIAS